MINSPQKIFTKIVSTNIIIIIIIISSFLYLYKSSFTSFYYADKKNELKTQALLVKNILINSSNFKILDLQELCINLKQETNTRYTIINDIGEVIGDSDENILEMDNHLFRPEIQESINKGIGASIRYSNTVNKEMLYLAIREVINNDLIIIRTSFSIESLQENISIITRKLIYIATIIMTFFFIYSYFTSRKIALPLERMALSAKLYAKENFSKKIERSKFFEIDSLAASLNIMKEKLDKRIKEITHQVDENNAILLSMNEGLIATNSLNEIIKINKPFKKIFKIDDSCMGFDIRNIIRNSYFLEFYNSLIKSSNVKTKKVTIDGVNGKSIFCSGAILQDKEGIYLGSVVIINDITKIKSLEKIRKEFVSNVSHELKTPLTALRGYIEALSESKDEDERISFINILEKNVSRMDAIINDLLELSKLDESNQLDVKKKKVNIYSLIYEAKSECEYFASTKNIQIIIKCDRNNVFILNERLVHEAIVNLIQNGISYSHERTKIIIESHIKENQLIISVKDFGIGIEDTHFDDIFKRFYCVDKSHSKTIGGTGLGLSIVKHIINLHNGTIEVESTLDKGSTFIIKLPQTLQT